MKYVAVGRLMNCASSEILLSAKSAAGDGNPIIRPPKYCVYMGLPRSWWEGSERHIQLSVVEHHPQFKALPVSVSPGF
ncbi:hypothetical protein, partial [Escherichia coli]|uniref:hypothetical protein n=1 Tax=Escherichia coli TaxID=562 RepID=UPI002AFFF357